MPGLGQGIMENWSIGKRKSGCEGFQEPSLNNNALTIERAVLPSLHHSITPSPHKPCPHGLIVLGKEGKEVTYGS